jgi:transposase
VLPTRPRRPRDKAKVEAAVLVVERWILARLVSVMQLLRAPFKNKGSNYGFRIVFRE